MPDPNATHCRRGHEYTPENTYWYNGSRNCRECQRIRAERRARKLGVKKRQPIVMPSDPVVLAYAAGIIDGEGSISIRKAGDKGKYRTGKYHTMLVRVGSTDKCLTDWLQEHFGGSVRTYQGRYKNCRTSYHWNLSCARSEALLRLIRPYLVIKGPQADVAIAFQETAVRDRFHGMPEGLVERREELRQQMLALNRREPIAA